MMQPGIPEIQPLHLFEGYGVELEYMIVDRQTLNIKSVANEVLAAIGGPWTREVDCGTLAWSNELVLHVIELKTNGPAKSLDSLHIPFEQDIRCINDILAPLQACLLPSAMHPWIRPDDEAALWQDEDAEIYTALDRIFSCQGHGWKNLQSVHLNLPFYDEAEFVCLHSAIRLILPLIPAIAAASPYMDSGCGSGVLDNRLIVYQNHCHRFPQAMGLVIPEPVKSIEQYHTDILEPIYKALKPYDPEGILAYEWINARGAITRFDRQTIEIRLIDVQECPVADIAIVRLITDAVRWLIEHHDSDLYLDNQIPSERLKAILQLTIQDAQDAWIQDTEYLRLMGIDKSSAAAHEIWSNLFNQVEGFTDSHEQAIINILKHGTLAWRMKKFVQSNKQNGLLPLYQSLSDCLAQGKMLLP